MKWQFLSVVLCFLTFLAGAQSQHALTTEQVAQEEVPEAVQEKFNEDFVDYSLVRWEKQISKGSKKTWTRYVVVFGLDGLKYRARYRADGTGISATAYYRFKTIEKLPSAVTEYAKNEYPTYKLNSAEKVQSLKNDGFVYRLRLREGATKVVVYVDETGKKLTKEKMPEELVDEGAG